MNRHKWATYAFNAFWGGLLLIDLLAGVWIVVSTFSAARTLHGYVVAGMLTLLAVSAWQVVIAVTAARLIAYADKWFGLGRQVTGVSRRPYCYMTTPYSLRTGKNLCEPVLQQFDGEYWEGYDVRNRAWRFADWLYGVRKRFTTTACLLAMGSLLLASIATGYWWLAAYGITVLGGWAIGVGVVLTLLPLVGIVVVLFTALHGGTANWPWLAKQPPRNYGDSS